MAYFMTSEQLIASIKRRANIPDSQAMITDEEILDFANEEMLLNLVPLVVSKHEDYYLTSEDVDLQDGVFSYPIPYRALGTKLRELTYFDYDSNRMTPLYRKSLDEITEDSSRGTSSSANRFYIMNENVVLDTNTTPSHDALSFFYNMRPNALVLVDRVATITSIDRTSGIITVNSIPDVFEATSKLDFIKLNSPHRILTYDLVPTLVDDANSQITFDPANIPQELIIGDQICLQNETNLVNAPSELHVMLAQMVAARVLEAIGDNENLAAANDKLARMEKSTEYLIDNRVTGSPIKASARRNGFLGRGRTLGRRR